MVPGKKPEDKLNGRDTEDDHQAQGIRCGCVFVYAITRPPIDVNGREVNDHRRRPFLAEFELRDDEDAVFEIRFSHDELVDFKKFQKQAMVIGSVLCHHDAEQAGRAGTDGKEMWRDQIDAAIKRGRVEGDR